MQAFRTTPWASQESGDQTLNSRWIHSKAYSSLTASRQGGCMGHTFFHCLSIQSTDFFPGSSHLGTGLVMASPPSGLSHTHRIHGAGRKMLTWLGYFLMGSMAHHIYPYIAYMDPMGYQVLVIVSGMIPPWEITWRRHVSKCCGPHLVTYTSTLPYFSAAASCRPIRFFTIFQLMGKRVEP